MLFSTLFREAKVTPAKIIGDAEVGVLCADSRLMNAGEVFVCMPSSNSDSHSFIPQAIDLGAGAVIVHSLAVLEQWSGKLPVALILEAEFEDSIWRLAKIAFGDPSKDLKIIGVTGTNGKTTVAWLMRDMLEALGIRTAYIGTLGFQLLGEEHDVPNTTPFAIDINRMLAECRDREIQVVSMEVSSHALAQKRVDGVEFDAAIFTNLTQDHLDFHGTMEEYTATKKRLFSDLPKASAKKFTGVANLEDPVGGKWANEFSLMTFFATDKTSSSLQRIDPKRITDFSPGSNEERPRAKIASSLRTLEGCQNLLFGSANEIALDHIDLKIASNGYDDGIGTAPIGGHFNVENLVAASAGLVALSTSTRILTNDPSMLEKIAGTFPKLRPVPGRFEVLHSKPGVSVILDFAHTPDALQKLLQSVKQLKPKRIITVFGCGGDRDKAKRPIMASAVSSESDLTIITSDNPRTEAPESILRDVERGIMPGKKFVSIVDRPTAVKYAIAEAELGDIVVLAGKGHQNFHIVGHTKFPMDERQLVRDAVEVLT